MMQQVAFFYNGKYNEFYFVGRCKIFFVITIEIMGAFSLCHFVNKKYYIQKQATK
jgi:hypothetical protein